MTSNLESQGAQRLSLEQLRAWEQLAYGMFLHFGYSTFDEGQEASPGDKPATLYAPDKLDVEQWASVARDAGMKYAILTAKHHAGHCLWPSKHTDFHVGNSTNKTDVVGAFVGACRERGVLPGLYYASWDNHHRMGSKTPLEINWDNGEDATYLFTTRAYRDFQWAQIEELLTQYGPLGEVWVDIPNMLPRDYRHELYDFMAKLQPDALLIFNHGLGMGEGVQFNAAKAWPTDAITIERIVPNSQKGHVPWREIEGENYYLPGEVCDTLGKEWFFQPDDAPRSVQELLGMYLLTRTRGANFLLNVPPDTHGVIPANYIETLTQLQKQIATFGV